MDDNKRLTKDEAAQHQTELYKTVLSCFRYGRANAVHMKDLERYSQLDNRRLRKIIELIRRDGVCVCADESGYYLPETAAELEKYITRVEATAKSTFFTLKTAKTELAKMQGETSKQLTISDVLENIEE